MSVLDRYKLDSRMHERVYALLKADAFADSTPVSNPSAVILGGQPGSGKSIVLDKSVSDFSGGNAIVINGDDFRKWHPKSEEILTTDEANYARLTDPDVREWTRRLFADAIESKRNIIFESTMRSPEPITSTMQNLMGQGYNVTARVLAVHRHESITGVFTRFERQKADHGHGRMAPIPVHDEAYAGLLDTLDAIESRNAANRIHVLSRDGETVHDAKCVNGRWDQALTASQAVTNQRNKPYTFDRAKRLVDTWKEVAQCLQDRNASPEEVAETGKAYSEIIRDIGPVLAANTSLTQRAAALSNADYLSKQFGLSTNKALDSNKAREQHKPNGYDAP